jgi:hypothetical protein
MALRKRKRAKGGGRKTIGSTAKSSNFSTRITPSTRGALEAEAALEHLSVSRMAEVLLELGLETRRLHNRRSPTEALLYLIGSLAEQCDVVFPGGKRFDWNTDQFVFDAFKVAISLLFEARELRPKESSTLKAELVKASLHSAYQEIFETPESLGKRAFVEVWDDFLHVAPPKKELLEHPPFPTQDMMGWAQLGYDLIRARRDLGIGEKKS